MPRGGTVGKFMEREFFDAIGELREEIRFFVIMGNDDPRINEKLFLEADKEGVIDYVHGGIRRFGDLNVVGYSMVPPSPFLLKDWELYDVSRHMDPGSVSPEEGIRTVDSDPRRIRYETISRQLEDLGSLSDPSETIYLFHAPPYNTPLDRAGLDGVMVDHAPLDVHVGSIAIRRFIEKRQPLLTLHGHIHESRTITGKWRHLLGRTWCFNGSNDGRELSLIRFDTDDIPSASLELLD